MSQKNDGGGMRLKRRYGKFSVSGGMLNPLGEGYLTRVMGACIVLRAEYFYANDRIEYMAYSFKFREISEGEIIPEYQFSFAQDGEMLVIETKGGAA